MPKFIDRMTSLFAGRRRLQPQRETEIYAKLVTIGQRVQKGQTAPKPTNANLRRFAANPAARRAINAIKNPVKMMDWEIQPMPGVKENALIQKQIEIASNCLRSPNHDDSDATLREQVVEDILVVSAGAIEMQIGSDPARPLWLWPVDANSIQIYPLWSGAASEARYRQVISGLAGLNDGRDLRNDELIYIRPNPNTAGPYGLGPLEVAFQTIARKIGVAQYAGNVASNAQPKDLMWLGDVDKAWLEGFRYFWRHEVEGQGQTPIIGGKMEPKVFPLHSGGDGALYLEWQNFLLREIAMAFDLSPQNMGVEGDVNRNTSEVAEDRDWNSAIIPMARLFEAHLTREAIHARLGWNQIRFKFVGIDRTDEKATADIYSVYYKANLITPNEQREKLGLPPLDNPYADMLAVDAETTAKAAQNMKANYDPNLKDGDAGPAAAAAPQPSPDQPEKGK